MMSHKCRITRSFVVLGTVVVVALHLRAAWDVAYSRSCAANLARDVQWLCRNAAPSGRCPALGDLGGFHRNAVVCSPNKFAFVSHGLLCSVERDRAHVPCSIVIRIGRPAILTQVVTLDHDSRMRMLKPIVKAGVLRSLGQKEEE